MKLTINKNPYEIPAFSELTCEQFIKVMTHEVLDIPSYISIFSDIPVDLLMKAEIKSASLTYIHARLFNVDVSKAFEEEKKVVEWQGKYYLLSDLTFKKFGQSYFFDIYHQQYIQKRITDNEMMLRALSVGLGDTDEIEERYQALLKTTWTKVMPHAFFLAKRYLIGYKILLKGSTLYMLELKATQKKINRSLKNIKKLEMI